MKSKIFRNNQPRFFILSVMMTRVLRNELGGKGLKAPQIVFGQFNGSVSNFMRSMMCVMLRSVRLSKLPDVLLCLLVLVPLGLKAQPNMSDTFRTRPGSLLFVRSTAY